MFSGLVKGIGRVASRTNLGADARFVIELGSLGPAPLAVGGSIAVNGVCLTAIAVGHVGFTADVSAATLAVTTMGRLAAGARVNLEPPLKAGDPLDGHIVTGHVDGVGEVISVETVGGSKRIVIFAFISCAAPRTTVDRSTCEGSVAAQYNDCVSLPFSCGYLAQRTASTRTCQDAYLQALQQCDAVKTSTIATTAHSNPNNEGDVRLVLETSH